MFNIAENLFSCQVELLEFVINMHERTVSLLGKQSVYYKSAPRLDRNTSSINPFQSNFSANRILPSSYLFWAAKKLVDYL
jgi:hypothetical protein